MSARFSVLEQVESHNGPLTAKDLAEILGVSPKSVYAGANKKLIPAYRINGAIRFDPRAVGYWLRKQDPSFAAADRAAKAAA